MLALVPELPGDQLARPMTDAMGDVVAGDVENPAVIDDAAHDDVGMRMAGVVMVDRDPVEPGAEIHFHLTHEIAGEAAQVAHVGRILRCDDETKLVTIIPAALHEGAAVSLVLEGRIGVALLAITQLPHPAQGTADGRRPPCGYCRASLGHAPGAAD